MQSNISDQLAVHLFRNYASVTFGEASAKGNLSPAQVRRLIEYIDSRPAPTTPS
jgi:hypothetical protein